jgi:hypothetical protein
MMLTTLLLQTLRMQERRLQARMRRRSVPVNNLLTLLSKRGRRQTLKKRVRRRKRKNWTPKLSAGWNFVLEWPR